MIQLYFNLKLTEKKRFDYSRVCYSTCSASACTKKINCNSNNETKFKWSFFHVNFEKSLGNYAHVKEFMIPGIASEFSSSERKKEHSPPSPVPSPPAKCLQTLTKIWHFLFLLKGLYPIPGILQQSCSRTNWFFPGIKTPNHSKK